MALHFLTSSDQTIDIYSTCDSSVNIDESKYFEYLKTGDVNLLELKDDATIFTLKPLTPEDRENAEIAAGALTRSELGRFLFINAPDDEKEKAIYHHALNEDERKAFSEYAGYIGRVTIEMIKKSLIKINGKPASFDMIQSIRPDQHRLQTITELSIHVQRISLVGDLGK